MARFLLVLVAVAVVAPDAEGQTYGYFPPVRSHGDQYLRASFRLPIEALLEASTPSQLAQRSIGEVPTLAAAPTRGNLADPFAVPPNDTEEKLNAELFVGDTDRFSEEVPVEETPADSTADSTNPFASGPEASEDPFAAGGENTADEDPFAFPSDGEAGGADEDPFAGF